MVISINTEPLKAEFELLLAETLSTLKKESIKQQKRYANLLGSKLEQEVVDILRDHSSGTEFEGSIELVSGQRFPDIVANKFYGIEVKTTKFNHWKSTGSSVAEGTRIADVERIFMLFGKMGDPIDFICKPYEDCLSEVVVTHSPRYLIDMQLKQGETIFDKINIPYNDLRTSSNPLDRVLNYYKKKLKPGESTWWSGNNDSDVNSVIIRIWNNLSKDERHSYMVKAFCLFPELLSNRPDKYNRFAVWLSVKQNVVCPNIRDMFTAGGRGSIVLNNIRYENLPQIVLQLTSCLDEIKKELEIIEESILLYYWEGTTIEQSIYDLWCELIYSEIQTLELNSFPIRSCLGV